MAQTRHSRIRRSTVSHSGRFLFAGRIDASLVETDGPPHTIYSLIWSSRDGH